MGLEYPHQSSYYLIMAKIRTFVAIEIPAEVAEALVIINLKGLSDGVRWVKAGNLHFTLRFLGDIDQNAVPELEQKLQTNLQDLPSFPLKLAGLGCFPNLRRPRVIWIGAGGDLDMLKELAHRVESACVDAGFGRGDKPFSAHLTIGRIKYPQGLEKLMTRLPEEKFESAEFPVSEVVIFKSDLSPRGPTYTALGRVRLGGE